MYQDPIFLPAGDQGLVIELGGEIDPQTNKFIHNLARAIEENKVSGLIDLIPTYRSLFVQYDSIITSYNGIKRDVTHILDEISNQDFRESRTIEIPILYGGSFGPDLEFVANHTNLTTDDVVNLHSGTLYLVHMMGFTPGFPYLGGLSRKLRTPRLPTPRPDIPAGSVGIADGQTGIYPVSTPGGWRIIGRTPLTLFDANRNPPSIIHAGDLIRFLPISDEDEYHRVRGPVIEQAGSNLRDSK